MLDRKYVREHFEEVKENLVQRGEDLSELDHFGELDAKRRELIAETEKLKARRNEASKQISALKKEKKNADDAIQEMRTVGEKISELDAELNEVEQKLEHLMLSIPNIPHSSVPIGSDDNENVKVRAWGEKPPFTFTPQAHWDIAENLGLLDFERAAKVTGSRFVFYKGLGARLERALFNFMMDLHEDKHGYTEMLPPHMVNPDSLTGTGQLPKFSDDVFHIPEWDYYLIPTSEVPVTNFYRNEIIDLPKQFVAFSANYRSEAGSAGRDTRGLIRQHQFNKVELVHFAKPEESYNTLETLTSHAEIVLQLLGLPYRVMNMCTGDLGFTAAKKYDVEVWMPNQNTYREISSCSNFEAFQARRAGIRYRPEKDAKPEYVHTLNGSGVATGRALASILENYQQEDGSVTIPEVLHPYMGGIEKLQ